MNSFRTRSGRRFTAIAAVLAIGLYILMFRLAFTPAAQPLPNRDSGIFLAVAQNWREGGLPYVDAWDQKPPGIHFVDMVGLALTPGTLWGVWLLQTAALMGAGWLSLACLWRLFGPIPALFATCLWLLSMQLIFLDNMPEIWGLLPMWAALLAFIRNEDQPRYGYGLAIGLCATALLFLKPTLIGLPVFMVLWLAVRAIRERSRRDAIQVAIVGITVLAVAGLVVFYFAARGGLSALYSAVITYNSIYARPDYNRWVEFLGLTLYRNGFALIGLAGAALAARDVLRRPPSVLSRPQQAATVVVLASAGTVVLMNAASGYGYFQYFLPFLMLYAYLAGYVAFVLLRDARPALAWIALLVLLVPSLGIAVSVARTGYSQLRHLPVRLSTPVAERDEVIAFLEANTGPDDLILIWGIEAGYSVVADRDMPRGYTVSYPYATDGYATDDMTAALMASLERQPPLYIFDGGTVADGLTPPIDPERRAAWLADPPTIFGATPAVLAFFEFVDTHYRVETRVTPSITPSVEWTVYRYDPPS